MRPWISNARMYAVTPDVEAAWQQLIEHVAQDAGVPLTYEAYAAPQPLEVLWRRSDLGCVFMCGYPIATKLADVQPIASPIPDATWAAGRALYRSDLIVRADSAFQDARGHLRRDARLDGRALPLGLQRPAPSPARPSRTGVEAISTRGASAPSSRRAAFSMR